MSLTSFIKDREVSKRFREEFRFPKMSIEKDLLIPPRSNRYSLLGIAFDYLLRFYVKTINPFATSEPFLLVEAALNSPISPLTKEGVFDCEKRAFVADEGNVAHHRVRAIYDRAKSEYLQYLATHQITDDLVESVLLLAQVDPIIRAGVVDRSLGHIVSDDVQELRELIRNVDATLFKAERHCLLDPDFGEGSRIVGGADVDMVIDDMIVEVKTTKNLALERKYVNQLIGYYALHEIGSVGGQNPKLNITRLGIYYSRHAYLHVMAVDELINGQTFPDFIKWFCAKAKAKYLAA